MSLVSSHEGVYQWLVKKGVVGKKRHNKNKVDLIIADYKKETGNEFHYFTFYPNRTFGKKWEMSKQEFNSFVTWAITKYSLNKNDPSYMVSYRSVQPNSAEDNVTGR